MLTDCHVHMASYDPREIPGVVQRANDAGVELIITAGTTQETSEKCIELAETYTSVYASVGIHPNRLREPLGDEAYAALYAMADGNPRVVAMSETGMDYLPTAPDKRWQEDAFREQIRLAHRLGLPIIWHSQVPEPGVPGQHSETLRILREERAATLGGVMHYFQADETTARQAIDDGFFISFAKPLLRFPHLWELAPKLPLEHIVLETDASPQAWKGSRELWTEPKDVPLIAQRLAELTGVTTEEVAQVTTANLKRMLGMPG